MHQYYYYQYYYLIVNIFVNIQSKLHIAKYFARYTSKLVSRLFYSGNYPQSPLSMNVIDIVDSDTIFAKRCKYIFQLCVVYVFVSFMGDSPKACSVNYSKITTETLDNKEREVNSSKIKSL